MALALNFAQRPLAGTAFCGKSFRSFGLLPIVLNQRHMTAVPKSQRPISPHVTIYKFPIPAISSIANRFCGAGLTMGMIDFYLILKHLGILTAGLLSLSGPDEVALALDNFKHHLPILVPFAKMAVGGPLVYHVLSGYRHLVQQFSNALIYNYFSSGTTLEG